MCCYVVVDVVVECLRVSCIFIVFDEEMWFCFSLEFEELVRIGVVFG